MPKLTPQAELKSFLDKFTPDIARQARAALARMKKRLPSANVLVYDNYNALALGFGPTERSSDAIFSIAVFPRWVSLFLLQGARARLPDPDGLLKGKGTQARHIVLTSPDLIDKKPVQRLIDEALKRASVPLDPKHKGQLIIKSISAKQRPRRP